MKELSNALANIGGILGILICLISGITRLSGYYYFFGYEAMTLFTGGIGLMVFACLAKLQVLWIHMTEERI